MFVLGGEEAASPITQFIYSTQTQFVTDWLNSGLCFGGGIIRWFNLIGTSYVGVIQTVYTLTCAHMHNLHIATTPSTRKWSYP